MNYYLDVFKKYALFHGRASRKEYWMFYLFNTVIAIALSIIDGFINIRVVGGIGILYLIYLLAVIIPSLALAFRRLHDTNRSAWWCLICIIPIIGVIIFLVFMVTDSTQGDNKYGPNPKGIQAQSA